MTLRTLAARTVFSLAAALAVSACATSESGSLADEPSFALGYGDGCQTAIERDKSFSTKVVRDEQLFESDKPYRGGWRHGFQSCGKRASQSPDGGRILGEEEGSRF